MIGTSVTYWLNRQIGYDSLIAYEQFIEENRFDASAIRRFAKMIGRDPGIVLGRLENETKVDYNDWTLHGLRHKYSLSELQDKNQPVFMTDLNGKKNG